MAEWSKTLDFEAELEIAQVQILSVTVALFISTFDLGAPEQKLSQRCLELTRPQWFGAESIYPTE
ncbi:hypothetical protein J6590_068299 [Homalodisca vitripennis]|nr:hypothetical protein J6590_068299 [Homalodisca vitripennis]